MSQQNASAAQIVVQHKEFEHEGVACDVQQSPAVGAPHAFAHAVHSSIARSTQDSSHCDSQQKGSCTQTALQQAVFEHDGVVLATQQLPLEGSPQPGPQTPQTSDAVCAQTVSQASMQHTGSTRQIERQHRSSAQPGVVRALQQLPACGVPHAPPQSPHKICAPCAQVASHSVSQQKPSSAQIASQQSASEHEGVVRAVQQSPLAASPQPIPQTPQIPRAAVAHVASHCVVQQNMSAAHTFSQHVASSQRAFAWATQQAPVSGLPHSSLQVPQYSMASSAQVVSHSTSQQ
jgi:hypothetical protein